MSLIKRNSVKQASFHTDFEDKGHYSMSDRDISLNDQAKKVWSQISKS